MSQKILASHCDGWDEFGLDNGCSKNPCDLIEVRVDQVVLARDPHRVLGTALASGLSKSAVEVAVAYPSRCIPVAERASAAQSELRIPNEAIGLGFLVGQPGAGFAPVVHLERFSSPARLVLTDEPRLAACGAAGMLTLPASRGQLAEALRTGRTSVRPARSIQIILSGRIRPFVSVRDVGLELLGKGLAEVVRTVDEAHQAPVILEFAGPSSKYLSVGDRAVLCALAPQVGAAGALFASDDKTETFLRDQRRSKAHRALAADSGAPFEQCISLDLASVEPLLMDDSGRICQVRELDGETVGQVLLGGDSGLSLRDYFAVAALLKSKRVAPGLDFLLCPGSRQTLEVLAQGALSDLIASGARLVEPDRCILSGDLYAPQSEGLSLKTCDHLSQRRGVIASPETLAFAVANGHIGDPRGFKRPVRVTVPRNLPTDDVLLIRGAEARGGAKGKGRFDHRAAEMADVMPASDRFSPPKARSPWNGPVVLTVLAQRGEVTSPSAYVAECLDDVRWLTESAVAEPELRAIIAAHIPAATVSVLSGLGVLALRADAATIAQVVCAKTLQVPAQESWDNGHVALELGEGSVTVDWLAVGPERDWTSGD